MNLDQALDILESGVGDTAKAREVVEAAFEKQKNDLEFQ